MRDTIELAGLGEAALGPQRAAVEGALAALAADRIVARIWAHDHTVWKPDPREITNRLGWLHVARDMQSRVAELHGLADAALSAGYTDALLLGMGGSSLAPELFGTVFRDETAGRPRLALAVLDSTDPAAVLQCADRHDPARTLYIVSTKSGTTVETLSFFRFFYNQVAGALGTERAGEHFLAITDPGSNLAGLAERHGFRATLLNDPTIGGRNSALSYFGLAPAALAGVDLPRLLERAQAMADACGANVRAPANPAACLGAVLGTLALAGRDKLTLVTSPAIAGFADWVEQLVAESTGKEGRGIVPVVGEPLGPPSAYGSDRLFVHLRLAGDDAADTALTALEADGHPVVRLRLHDRYDLGGHFFLWGLAVAVAGHLLGVNPFDQPNVEAAKVLARQMVDEYVARGTLPHCEWVPPGAQELERFLAQARPGDYVAVQAYLAPTPETTAALQALRTAVRDRLRLATTLGYGPRFLHSTGQLHKGGAANGLFIQVTADNRRDVPIPDAAGAPGSRITFGVLEAAQALGDREALRQAGRRVIRFHLGGDVIGGLGLLHG